jgi:hypothetical protein
LTFSTLAMTSDSVGSATARRRTPRCSLALPTTCRLRGPSYCRKDYLFKPFATVCQRQLWMRWAIHSQSHRQLSGSGQRMRRSAETPLRPQGVGIAKVDLGQVSNFNKVQRAFVVFRNDRSRLSLRPKRLIIRRILRRVPAHVGGSLRARRQGCRPIRQARCPPLRA